MPVSFLAHQVPLAPLKVIRPTWFDATALCVGSLMPDLLYAYISSNTDTNHIRTFGPHGLVVGLVLTIVLRYLVVPVVAAHLPDLGPARLRSLSVIDARRPPPHVTLASLAIGLCSHAALDWFTHDDRRGPDVLGYDDVVVTFFGWTGSLASAFQIAGSIIGVLVAVWIFHWLGRNRMIELWYGDAAVERARAWVPGTLSFVGLTVFAALGAIVGALLRNPDDAFISLQRIAVGVFAGMMTWSVVRWPARRVALRSYDNRSSMAASVVPPSLETSPPATCA